MTIYVCGGGTLAEIDPLIKRFIRDIDGGRDRLALITAGGIPHAELRERLQSRFTLGFELELDATEVLEPVDGGELLGCDTIVVSGDNPAQLLSALEHRVVDVRRLMHEGAAYLGVEAGAALASDIAWIGGNAIGGIPVAPGVEVAELEFVEGIGLVDITVIPDAVGSGRIGIAAAAVEAGIVDRTVGIDAGTALVAKQGELFLHGSGSVWQFEVIDDLVTLTSLRASETS